MATCKGTIYYTTKSKKAPTRCTNKPKDINGFCHKHSKQSEQWGRTHHDHVLITVAYNGNTTFIKMREHQQIGICLPALNQKFGTVNHQLFLNGNLVDNELQAINFDGVQLNLI